MNFFELYYAYLAQCERDNWANMRDPNHDYMEWNHTLPQCIFDDQPIGQWLTIEQHAIASALQTLAFRTNCLYGGMLKLLPADLSSLCRPHFTAMCSKTRPNFTQEDLNRRSLLMSETNLQNHQRGLHPMQKVENRISASERAKDLFRRMVEEGTHPSIKEGASERITAQNLQRVSNGTHNFQGEKAARRASEMQLERVREGIHPWKTEEHSAQVRDRFAGAKHWVNERGERRFQKEKPEGEWQNGRKWRNSK